MSSRSLSIGISLALLSALGYSISGPLIKPLLEAGWTPAAALAVRTALAGLVLSPALVRAMRRERAFTRKHGVTVLMFGLFGVAIGQLFLFSAMERIQVGVALLLQFMAPIILVFYVWLRTKRRPSVSVFLGAGVTLIGLVFVVDLSGVQFDVLGALFGLGAAVCSCVYFVISQKSGDSLPPIALSSGGLLVAAVFLTGFGALGVFPFEMPSITTTLLGAQVPGIVPVAIVGLVGTSLGYACGVSAVPKIGLRLASFLGLSEVLFTLVLSWLLLGEVLTGGQLLGAGLIIIGVIWIRRERNT